MIFAPVDHIDEVLDLALETEPVPDEAGNGSGGPEIGPPKERAAAHARTDRP
jgi:hypothetical protein